MIFFPFSYTPTQQERTKNKKRHTYITRTHTTVSTFFAICKKERRNKLVLQNVFVYIENVDWK
jgi:hypothetical protein